MHLLLWRGQHGKELRPPENSEHQFAWCVNEKDPPALGKPSDSFNPANILTAPHERPTLSEWLLNP